MNHTHLFLPCLLCLAILRCCGARTAEPLESARLPVASVVTSPTPGRVG